MDVGNEQRIKEEKAIILSPIRKTFKSIGKIFYYPNQGWNTLRIKQEVLHEFPQLKERNGKFGYLMTIPKTFKEAKKLLIEGERKEEVVPIFLYFLKFKNNRKV